MTKTSLNLTIVNEWVNTRDSIDSSDSNIFILKQPLSWIILELQVRTQASSSSVVGHGNKVFYLHVASGFIAGLSVRRV